MEIREEYTEPSVQPTVETTKTNEMATTTMQGANSYTGIINRDVFFQKKNNHVWR